MRKATLFSFFSGAGFLDLGFEDAGFEIVFANEISDSFSYANKFARMKMQRKAPVYGFHTSDIKSYLDVGPLAELRDMIHSERNEKNRLTGFIGGPPCPDFSIAGKNLGIHGAHGCLSQIYMNLITACEPDFFFFENVKGLLRTKKHKEFFYKLLIQARSSGYNITYKILNALQYGVPQDRERVFLVGIHKKILKSNNGSPIQFCWGDKQASEKIKAMPWPTKSPFCPGDLPPPAGVDLGLTVQTWFEKNKVQEHPNARDFFQPRAILKKMLQIEEGDDSRKSSKRLHRWRYSPTAAYGNNEVHIHPYLNRRISAAEALAIQSMPAAYSLPADMTLTAKFKTIGNGVPYLMAKGVATALRKYLEEISSD